MRFLKSIDPLRPELFRYCRRLARNVWDAEDLLQDTLLKAFAKLAEVHWDMHNPRAYMFRIATNLWIDKVRARNASEGAELEQPEQADPQPLPTETREAVRELARLLAPRERAALLLKDVFDFSLEETANYLQTTTGAVKASLHRAREKLGANRDQAERPAAPSAQSNPDPVLLDQWCEAFNARDLPRLASLMLEDASAEVVGMVAEYDRKQIRDGSFHHTIFDEEGEPQAERREYLGEPIVVLWYAVNGKRAVRDVLRFTADRGGVASLRYYYFCPETLSEVCEALGLPLVDNGYRYG